MKKIVVTSLILFFSYYAGFSQSKISGKFNFGYLYFGARTITVDNDPKFEGYNLENKQNGVGVNLISGLKFNEKLFAGIGVGYLNFDLNNDGIQGFSVFSNFEYTPPSYKRTNFYLQTSIGYSQLFSQFWDKTRNETGTSLVELGFGLKYSLTSKMVVYIKSGTLFTQQSLFFPAQLGIGF